MTGREDAGRAVAERAEAAIRATFADAGCEGWLHAAPIPASASQAPPSSVSVDAHRPVAMASVYKLPLAIALAREFDAGSLDPGEQVAIDPTTTTAGPSGVSLLRHPARLSLRDLAVSMMAVSDNAAADLLLARVGLAAVDAVLRDAGCRATRVRFGTAGMHEWLLEATETSTLGEALAAMREDTALDVGAHDPAFVSSTTAADMVALLTALWEGRLASAAETAELVSTMGRQLFRYRLASGFAQPGAEVAGKTGTIGRLRHEVGVVTHPGEQPIAVAVFTRAARSEPELPVVDAAIGRAARQAVNALRPGWLGG
ncbi:serine hydrolase [Micrococcaceae bacterium RIT802]|nr:serine hydrolase [Micrococcaceae bacterium RIT 802]